MFTCKGKEIHLKIELYNHRYIINLKKQWRMKRVKVEKYLYQILSTVRFAIFGP